MSDNNTCWLCLDESTEANPCLSNCACSTRASHASCLQRWQLQCAGSMEETQCRFCSAPYATGWRTMPTPSSIFSRPSSPNKPTRPAESACPRIKVNGPDNRHVMLPLFPGDEGKRQFERDVRSFLKLGPEAKININFEAKVPLSLTSHSINASSSSSSHTNATSERVRLDGLKTYDAAFHCASLAAKERRMSFASAKPDSGSTTAAPGVQKRTNPSAPPTARQVQAGGSSGGGGGSDVGKWRQSDQIQTRPSNALHPKPSQAKRAGKNKGGEGGWVSKMMDLVTFRSGRDQSSANKTWVFHQSPQAF